MAFTTPIAGVGAGSRLRGAEEDTATETAVGVIVERLDAGAAEEISSECCCVAGIVGCGRGSVALLPKRAQAFFHLHCVHQRSRCSNP